MNSKEEKILVTGGAGFIGSHIVERLVKDKQNVRILDNFSSGKIENLEGFSKKVQIIKGDIVSKATCLRATKGIDFVLHQAALRSVPKSMKSRMDITKLILMALSICSKLAEITELRGLSLLHQAQFTEKLMIFQKKSHLYLLQFHPML